MSTSQFLPDRQHQEECRAVTVSVPVGRPEPERDCLGRSLNRQRALAAGPMPRTPASLTNRGDEQAEDGVSNSG